jgi:hypothetical protein
MRAQLLNRVRSLPPHPRGEGETLSRSRESRYFVTQSSERKIRDLILVRP